jgi:WD40 repeat protein
MNEIKANDNFIIKRRISIEKHLTNFFPNVVSKLISDYDYYLEGKAYNFKGHTSLIMCLAILPDERIVSGSFDNTIKVWNTNTGLCDITLTGHSQCVKCIAVVFLKQKSENNYPDGQNNFRLVSGSLDKTLKVWNVQSGLCERTFKTHPHNISHIDTLSDGRILTRMGYGILKIWNIVKYYDNNITQTEKYERELPILSYIGVHTVLSDGRLIIGSIDGNFSIYNIQTEKEDTKIEYGNMISNVCNYIDGRIICEGIKHDKIEISLWNQQTGKCDNKFFTKSDGCIGVLPDGRIVIEAKNNILKICNLQTGKCDIILMNLSKLNRSMAVFSDGRIVTGSVNGTVTLWS